MPRNNSKEIKNFVNFFFNDRKWGGKFSLSQERRKKFKIIKSFRRKIIRFKKKKKRKLDRGLESVTFQVRLLPSFIWIVRGWIKLISATRLCVNFQKNQVSFFLSFFLKFYDTEQYLFRSMQTFLDRLWKDCRISRLFTDFGMSMSIFGRLINVWIKIDKTLLPFMTKSNFDIQWQVQTGRHTKIILTESVTTVKHQPMVNPCVELNF